MTAQKKVFFVALLVVEALSTRAQVLTVDLPDISLQPNRAGQTFIIDVGGGPRSDITALTLNLQVGSQPDPSSPGFDLGPKIEAIDVITGTPFEGHVLNSGGGPIFEAPSSQLWEADVRASSARTLPTAGQHLATVTISTVGINSGRFDYTIDTVNGHTTFGTTGADFDAVLVGGAGTLTVVPEPGAYALIGGLGCLASAGWLRRSRMQKS
jgi:hypothetical protein